MVYNDTTNLQGILQDAEFRLNLPNGTLSTTFVKDATRFANQYVATVQAWILAARDEWDYDDTNHTTYPILTANLVSGQYFYTFPTDILKIQRVEVSWDGTTWKKAEPFDQSNFDKPLDDTTIATYFSKDEPHYDTTYDSFRLLPTPDANVTDGLKIYVARECDVFATTDTTQEPGFDYMWHYIIPLGIAYEWSKAKGFSQMPALKQELLEAEQRLKQYYTDKQEERQPNLGTKRFNWK